jgi:phosphatidylserine/phosphatidylglycerophosphate/cardiolipin synthase-like enzyme
MMTVRALLLMATLAGTTAAGITRPSVCLDTQDTLKLWFAQDSLGRRLVDFFDGAVSSIDYACYNSSRLDVDTALVRARSRGVRVRVITDNARLDDDWLAYLRGAGVVVWSDSMGPGASNYMHNKFVARDLDDSDSTNDRVWSASYNPNQDETNADYALEIPSTTLARAYRAEFEQMWGGTGNTPNPSQARFHTAKTDVLAGHSFTVGGYPAKLYFSPQNDNVDTITAVAGRSQTEIAFAVNSFTWENLGTVMLSHWASGDRVFGVIDRADALSPASQYSRLHGAGMPVLIDSVRFGYGTLHEKLMVVDSVVTVTGSANWSNNANNSNDENTLILSNPLLARKFHAEILRRFLEAGGTYPPSGVADAGSTPPTTAQVFCPSPTVIGNLPAGAVLYDACGRRVVSRQPARGAYFLVQAGWIQPVVRFH